MTETEGDIAIKTQPSQSEKLAKVGVSEALAETVRKLWSSNDFYASYSGVSSFQKALHVSKGIDLTKRQVRTILNTITHYVMHVIKKKRFKTRSFDNVSGFGLVLQMDLGFLGKNHI